MKVSSLVKLLFMLAAICVSCAAVLAQEKDWRPITPEELAAKPVVEPDADAEAIFWEVRINDKSDDLSLRHYVRVKVFTERGREKYSKFDIPFMKGLKIKELAARVVRPDGSISEIKKEDIFEREIVKAGGVKIKAKSFAVPNIEPGVIVEYRYQETLGGASARGMRLAFQRDVPIQTLSYYYKPGTGEPSYQAYNFSGTKFVKDEKGYWLATRKNVPAFREEPLMPPADTVRPWMLLTWPAWSLTSTSNGRFYVEKDPSSPSKYWGGVGFEIAPLVTLMTKSSGDIKKTAEQVTAGAATTDEKLQKLYQFVQTQIRNVAFETTVTEEDKKKVARIDSMADVLKRKMGQPLHVDLLFGSLASSLGFETRIAYSADRSEMFFQPEMTNEAFIHPSSIAVNVGGDWKYFNPGMAYLPYGMLVWYEEDTWALLVGEKQFSWEKTPMTTHERSTSKRQGKFKLLPDGTLEGEVLVERVGQPAVTYRMENYEESANKREENLREGIKKRISTAEISDVRIENVTDPSKPLIEAYKIRIPSYAQKTGKRLFLQPGFFEYGGEPIFAGAARKYDVYFRYPWSENDSVTIQLPPGFDLDSADAPGDLSDPKKIGFLGITMQVDKDNSLLQYDRKFHFGAGGKILFPASAYSAVKGLFDGFQKAESHTITLKQK